MKVSGPIHFVTLCYTTMLQVKTDVKFLLRIMHPQFV